MHPFDHLGKSPFRCVGMRKNVFSIPGCPEATKPGGSCQHCGTGIMYEFVIEDAEGKRFVVGSDCVEKTGAEVSEFRRIRLAAEREKRAVKRSARELERQLQWKAEADAKRVKFDAEQPEVVAFLLSIEQDADGFLGDMRRSYDRYGSLTERMLDAVKNSMKRSAERAEREATAKPIPATDKRLTIEGVIISAQYRESNYDSGFFSPASVKVTVEHADGWRAWGTLPSEMWAHMVTYERGELSDRTHVLKGRRIKFDARVVRSEKDEKFGFFKRPTKATFTDEQAAA